jgi:glycosyltransferase involved in cell wall biosynthesis
VAGAIPGVRVIDEPSKGLVVARETGRRAASGDILAYVDADCRVPLQWLERVERRFETRPSPVAVTGPYQFYDWDRTGRALLRGYDLFVAPLTHAIVHHVLGLGAILYGGNFAVRSSALAAIGGFDVSVEFHGEDTNLGRRLTPHGRVALAGDCWVWTSARRYHAMGKWTVFSLYVRNFWSEILRHRPADRDHIDVRI